MSQSHNGEQTESKLAGHLRALLKFSTPTIANAISLIDGGRRSAGFAHGGIRALHRRSKAIVGYAVTATCQSAPPLRQTSPRLTTDDVITGNLDRPGPVIFVLQDLEPAPRNAVFGEMLATAFASFGYSGLITNGACRDIAEIRRLGFPCWCSTVAAGFAGGGYVECNVPVEVDGLHIQPGDLLHADSNGIVQIPQELLPRIVDVSKRFNAIECKALIKMRQMSNDIGQLRKIFKELRRSIDELRDRPPAKVEVSVLLKKPVKVSDALVSD